MSASGPIDAKGEISEDGNKMIIDEGRVREADPHQKHVAHAVGKSHII